MTSRLQTMNVGQQTRAQQRITSSRTNLWMQRIQKFLDDYYLDAVAGFLPWGIGDIGSALFSLVYIWFAATKVRSLPLLLAILNNTLRDVMLGMIPFYIGDVIDFFHRANSQNMQLISGFVNGDKEVIHEVNRKAWASAIFIALSLVITALLIWATVEITSWLFNSIMK